MKRLIEQEACDHGEFEYHSVNGNDWVKCPGGTTTRIEPDYEARQFANLTSPETIEKACSGKWGIWWKTMSEEAKQIERADMKRALLAVTEDTE